MSKTVLIGLVVGALIIGAAGFFLINSQNSQTPATETSELTASENPDTPRSLRDLMSFANNQTCTFSDDEGNSGVVYVSNNNMRGDFTSTSNSETVEGHTIIKDNTAYVWFDENTEGFQMSLESVSDLQVDQDEDTPKSLDIDKQVNYECTDWNVDQSVFQTPSTVTFTDYSSMMESASEMMETMDMDTSSQAQCAACNSLPAAAQEQCLQTLNCN